MSLATCCREICSEQGGRAIRKGKKRKENSNIDSEWRLYLGIRPYHILLSSKKYRKGFIDVSKIKCVEIVKNDDGVIPCQNKYPFQQKPSGRYVLDCIGKLNSSQS
ncbi:hypothetical protein FD754_020526 [Muntiacus muntjak]|uniref:Uncharacterized protein n=1 Tax=Muntiacus muntjak TaxID=9888 RepID=A0A5N3V4T8_MUNMU|nr:hypothetical protein FD754_020526 [Muntiacus muntjak]